MTSAEVHKHIEQQHGSGGSGGSDPLNLRYNRSPKGGPCRNTFFKRATVLTA
jgi:hypothetical protein